MGTRALIHIKNEDRIITTIYRHYDGYPEGLGQELKDILSGKDIPEGYLRGHQNPGDFYNGMQCLAAYVIKSLKTEWGNVYIYPPNSRDCGEEFVYLIEEKDKKLTLSIMVVYNEDRKLAETIVFE